jgi:hypothetical protein
MALPGLKQRQPGHFERNPMKLTKGFGLPSVSDRAYDTVQEVIDKGTITGMVGAKILSKPMSLRRLADSGVPENLDLPYDTDKLRSEVRELAQFLVD